MKIIEWAFLCSSAAVNQNSGLDVKNISEKFNLADLDALYLVFKIFFVPDGGPLLMFDDWILQVAVYDELGNRVGGAQQELIYTPHIVFLPLDIETRSPGIYKVEILATGIVEHRLMLQLF
jgi:hypothetical protein